MKPVCLVIGAGAGIGGNVARRFAQAGYHACLCRRSDLEGLNRMVDSINDEGGSASGFLLNAIEETALKSGLPPSRRTSVRSRSSSTTWAPRSATGRSAIRLSRHSKRDGDSARSACFVLHRSFAR